MNHRTIINFFGFIFFTLLFFLPFEFVLGADPFLVTEFVQEKDIFVGIFDLKGRVVKSFPVGSFDISQGVSLACGDVDSDKKEEIVVVSKSGSSSIKIFSHEGELKYRDFFAYNKNYQGGVNLALGDLNSDSRDEIIVSPRKGNLPIKVFDFKGNVLNSGFYPFSKNYRGEIVLAAGDINSDDKEEIAVGTGKGSESEVKFFTLSGEVMPIQFFPFGNSFKGGVSLALGDIDGKGENEVVICEESQGSWCKAYQYNRNKTVLKDWHAFDSPSGTSVSMADINRDGKDEIIVLTNFGGYNIIKAFTIEGKLKSLLNFHIPNSSTNISNVDVFFDLKRDKAKVTYVDDGDTIFLNTGEEIRYIGMDTPEVGENYYLEATNRNKELLFEKEVELEYDKQKIDPNGRVLAYIFANGDFVNTRLVEEGLARVKTFPPDEKYLNLLKEKEKKAKEEKIGIWQKGEDNKSNFWNLFGIFKLFL